MTVPAVPGWYEHPPGTGSLRWWDGTRWQPLPSTLDQPELAPGTTTGTWAIWVMAVLPLLGPVIALAEDLPAQTRARIALLHHQTVWLAQGGAHPLVLGFPPISPALLIGQGTSLVLVAVHVLLAVSDHRSLAARGIVRPFHWAWAFLQPVYVIGRAVVVRRRTGRGLAPLFVWIAAEVVGLGATVVLSLSAVTGSS